MPTGRHLAHQLAISLPVARPRQPAGQQVQQHPVRHQHRQEFDRLGERGKPGFRPLAGSGRLDQSAGEPPTGEKLLFGDGQPRQHRLKPFRRPTDYGHRTDQRPSQPCRSRTDDRDEDPERVHPQPPEPRDRRHAANAAERCGNHHKRHHERQQQQVIGPRRTTHDSIGDEHRAAQQDEAPTGKPHRLLKLVGKDRLGPNRQR